MESGYYALQLLSSEITSLQQRQQKELNEYSHIEAANILQQIIEDLDYIYNAIRYFLKFLENKSKKEKES